MGNATTVYDSRFIALSYAFFVSEKLVNNKWKIGNQTDYLTIFVIWWVSNNKLTNYQNWLDIFDKSTYGHKKRPNVNQAKSSKKFNSKSCLTLLWLAYSWLTLDIDQIQTTVRVLLWYNVWSCTRSVSCHMLYKSW